MVEFIGGDRVPPLFERWLAELAEGDQEILGDVMALLTALEDYGRDLDDEAREESHPVVTARYDLHALRRTLPTEAAPYATGPPVLRILYAYCRRAGEEIAVVLIGGDKTSLGNLWYRHNITEAETRLDQYCRQHPNVTPIVMRGDR